LQSGMPGICYTLNFPLHIYKDIITGQTPYPDIKKERRYFI